ncbi:MAG: hypothetical protein A2289_10610 [Deltaproteobacteria bacterium RIFOXYA12_FULL_58_15]|nr:MAG: hypothetical protein A2289_10610 [Deltaproteobacteria bacterium RIFOXYA12_FULL_58_15]
MALPPVPNLDPNAPEDASEPAAAPPPSPVLPEPRVTIRQAVSPELTRIAIEQEASLKIPSPENDPPVPTTAPKKQERRETGGVVDSVEEVLQQSSEQTLRLAHLEDAVNALAQTFSDFQDEMHAGFAEVRAVTEATAAQQPVAVGMSGRESLTERLDFVEEQASQGNKRQGLLTVLAILQTILLIAMLAIVLMAKNKPTTELPPPAYKEPARLEPPLPNDLPNPSVADDPRGKKKRRKYN